MTCFFIGFDFQNPNPGCQRLPEFENITEEICVEDPWKAMKSKERGSQLQTRGGGEGEAGNSTAWLSCSRAPFSMHPLEATVRDGVLKKTNFWSAVISWSYVTCLHRQALLGQSSRPRKLYHQSYALSPMFILVCFAAFYNIMSCSISFKSWRNNQCCLFMDQLCDSGNFIVLKA